MGIQINGQTDTISAVDNNFSLAGNVSIGGTLTYEDVTSVDAVGLSTFQAGIQLDDSITHLGDTDTKIRFPADDTITVETAGSERLRITSAGLVGINTTDPQKTLHVASASANSFGIVRISGQNRGGQLEFATDATKTAGIYSPTNSNELIFFTSSSETERLRIASDGNIGIGTDNPSDELSVVSSLTTDSVLRLQGGTSAGKGSGIRLMKGASAVGYIGPESWLFGSANTSNTLVISQNAQANLSITSAGNIGVGGLTNPGALLSIPAGESNTPRLAIESAVDDNDFTITQYEDGNGTYTMLGQNVKLNSDGNNTILDSGHRTAGILLDARNHGAITFLTGAANAVVESIKINQYGGLKVFNASSNISGTDIGALYFNTLEKRLKVYNGNAWSNTDIASDPYWSSVVLLIQGASTITDASGRHTLSLNGNASTSTTHTSPVGNSHTIRLCSGNASDYLNVQSNLGDFRLDDSDWTFEYWVRIVDTGTSYFHIFSADGQNARGTFKGYSASSTIDSMYFYSSQGSGLSHNTNSTFTHNAWMHVAWEFDDSADDFRLYIGGVLRETNTSMTFQGGNPVHAYFGRNVNQTNEHLEFYIDNIRWTRGVCRYNGTNFSPPTSPYPTS